MQTESMLNSENSVKGFGEKFFMCLFMFSLCSEIEALNKSRPYRGEDLPQAHRGIFPK